MVASLVFFSLFIIASLKHWSSVAKRRKRCPAIYTRGRWTPPARGSRDQNPPTIGTDHITAGLPYTAVDCRRPSISCRRCPPLERPAAPRHVRIISACFPKPSEDAPLPAFFPVTFVQCLQSDSCHYWHSNRSFHLLTYLLTYLVIYSLTTAGAKKSGQTMWRPERVDREWQLRIGQLCPARKWSSSDPQWSAAPSPLSTQPSSHCGFVFWNHV